MAFSALRIYQAALHLALRFLCQTFDLALICNEWIILPSQSEQLERLTITPLATTVLYALAEPAFAYLEHSFDVLPALLVLYLICVHFVWVMLSRMVAETVIEKLEAFTAEHNAQYSYGKEASTRMPQTAYTPEFWTTRLRHTLFAPAQTTALALSASINAGMLLLSQRVASRWQDSASVALGSIAVIVYLAIYRLGNSHISKFLKKVPVASSSRWAAISRLFLQCIVKMGLRFHVGLDPFMFDMNMHIKDMNAASEMVGDAPSKGWLRCFLQTMNFCHAVAVGVAIAAWWCWKAATRARADITRMQD